MQKEEPTEHTEHTESSCQVHGQRQTRVHRLVCFRGEPSRPLWLNLFRVFRVFRGPTAFFNCIAPYRPPGRKVKCVRVRIQRTDLGSARCSSVARSCATS